MMLKKEVEHMATAMELAMDMAMAMAMDMAMDMAMAMERKIVITKKNKNILYEV